MAAGLPIIINPADLIAKQHLPAADTAAVVTVDAVEGKRHVLYQVWWSYSAAPTGGRLTVAFGAATLLDIDITEPGYDDWCGPLFVRDPDNTNEAMVVTLAAGGDSVVGSLNLTHLTL